MKTQTIRIDGVIDPLWSDNGAKKIAQDISLAELDSGDVLNIAINSPGGAVFESLGIIGAINKAKSEGIKTVAIVEGLAASAASLIACACDEVEMAIGSLMMVHNVQSGSFGDHHQLRADADLSEKITNSIAGIYVAKTGKSLEEVTSLLDSTTWMSAEEAVELGFADRVSGSLSMVACASIGLGDFKIPERFQNIVAEASEEKQAEEAAPIPTPEPVASSEQLEAAAPQVTAPDLDAVRFEAVKAERERVAGIQALALNGVDVSEFINSGASVADAAVKIIELAKNVKPTPTNAALMLAEMRASMSSPDAFSIPENGEFQIYNHYKNIVDPSERAKFFAQNRDVITQYSKIQNTNKEA